MQASEDNIIVATIATLFQAIVINICCLGLTGNFLSAVILSRPQMRNTHINVLLLGLTFYDSLFLISNLGMALDYENVFILPSLFAQSGSIYFTLLICVERFIVIYWPLHARSLLTLSNSKWAIVIVTLASLLVIVPDILLHLLLNQLNWFVVIYENYWIWGQLIFRIAIPIFLLLVFSVLIITKMRRVAKERRSLRNQGQDEENASDENSINKVILCVIFVFAISYAPQFPRNLFYFYYLKTKDDDNDLASKNLNLYAFLLYLSRITACVNSSVNFIIYCAIRKTFREEFFLQGAKMVNLVRCNRTSDEPQNMEIFTPAHRRQIQTTRL